MDGEVEQREGRTRERRSKGWEEEEEEEEKGSLKKVQAV